MSGGSTSVGLYLIPLLKLAGLKVIATASPRSFDLVKKYGADQVVDYHDVDKAVAEIKDVTGGGVWKGLEAVGGDDNFRLSVQSFQSEGGQLTTLTLIPDGADKIREDVKIDRVLLYTVGGYVSTQRSSRRSLRPAPQVAIHFPAGGMWREALESTDPR